MLCFFIKKKKSLWCVLLNICWRGGICECCGFKLLPVVWFRELVSFDYNICTIFTIFIIYLFDQTFFLFLVLLRAMSLLYTSSVLLGSFAVFCD